ncbi:MAG: hypothetical protein NZT92_10285, partial [Abditibacteriales bacterium]|nr:hypothetical protein [Abditibacteriales bacterium]MDW8368472.1 hypothetical protein [Abditibacteriales bacterium]
YLTLETNGVIFKARTHPDQPFDRGDTVRVRFLPHKVHLFDKATGETLLERDGRRWRQPQGGL